MAKRVEYVGTTQAVQYLVSRGIEPPKRTSRSSEASYEKIVRRYYTKTRAYEQAYGVTPSRSELRGHGPKTEHIPEGGRGKEYNKLVYEQYRSGSKQNPVTVAGFVRLLEKANPGGRYKGPMKGNITGIMKEYRGEHHVFQTISFSLVSGYPEARKIIEQANGNILQLAQNLTGHEYIKVYSINLAAY